MFAALASFFTGTPIPTETVRSRLRRVLAGRELAVFRIFSDGAITEPSEFCEKAIRVLQQEDPSGTSERAFDELDALFEEAYDRSVGSLSFTNLKEALERPVVPQLGGGGAMAGSAGDGLNDIFAGSRSASEDGWIDRQSFRLAMLRLGLNAAPNEIDALFDSIDEAGEGVVRREELLHLLRDRKQGGGGRGGSGGGGGGGGACAAMTMGACLGSPVPKGSGGAGGAHHYQQAGPAKRGPLLATRHAELGEQSAALVEDAAIKAAEAARIADSARQAAAERVAATRKSSPRAPSPRVVQPHVPRQPAPKPPPLRASERRARSPRPSAAPPPQGETTSPLPRATRPVSTPDSRRQHCNRQIRLTNKLSQKTPGPGWYEGENVATSFGRSSRFGGAAAQDKASAWASSGTQRFEHDPSEPEGLATSDPGVYNPKSLSRPSIAERALAASSPSTNAQKGIGWHTGSDRVTLTRLPFRQNYEGSASPGPGHYHHYEELYGSIARETRKTSVNGLASARGMGSVAFRSSTAQRAPTEPHERERAPPPGSYDIEPGWLSKARDGDGARTIFASKLDRFADEPSRTGESVGPGSYDPGAGEGAAKERSMGGQEGARSYPFNSTDRRYRRSKTGPTEEDLYMSTDGRLYH